MSRRTHPLSRTLTLAILALVATVGAFLLSSVVGAGVAMAGSRVPLAVSAEQISPHYESVTFQSRVDHLRLSGWLLHADHPTGRSLILVHGYRGNREDIDFVPIARAMLARGYDVLMFDLRASGASAGNAETLANDEPRDLLGAYDFMVGHGYAPRQMAILGNSMGAATVIEAAPQLSEVGALISDSAFAELGPSMRAAVSNYTGLPQLLAEPAILVARAYGLQPALDPAAVVHGLPQRAFLFVHSRGDTLLPVRNAYELKAASSNPQSRLLVIDGRDHVDTYNHDPARFLQALNGFIDEQLAAHRHR